MSKECQVADLDETAEEVVQRYTRAVCDALNEMDISSIRQLVREMESEAALVT